MEKRTPPTSRPTAKTTAFLGGSLLVLLGIGTGGAILLPTDAGADHPPPGPVTVQVPGAIGVSVFCGGDETAHANGTEVMVTPTERTCHVEAPLTPVMPLRGTLTIGESDTYRCVRDNVDLKCTSAD